jgi:hypothetical protein
MGCQHDREGNNNIVKTARIPGTSTAVRTTKAAGSIQILNKRDLEYRDRRQKEHAPRNGGNNSGREDGRDNNNNRDANNRDYDNSWEPKNANDSNNIANRRVNSEGEKTRASR